MNNNDISAVENYDMDGARHPSKSILKDNTMPLLHDKRRVSFAPEVTLHKIDFLPSSSKRRKTIGFQPSVDSQYTDLNGTSALQQMSDSSDEDEVTLSTETSNGKTYESEDIEEEVTMELTGQINMIKNVNMTEKTHDAVAPPISEADALDKLVDSKEDDSANNNELLQECNQPVVIDEHLSSDEDEGEVNMEITEGPKLYSNRIYEPDSNIEIEEDKNDLENGQGGDDMEVTMNITTVFNKQIENEETGKNESIMDITNTSKYNIHQFEENNDNLNFNKRNSDDNYTQNPENFNGENEELQDKDMELTVIPLKQIRDNVELINNTSEQFDSMLSAGSLYGYQEGALKDTHSSTEASGHENNTLKNEVGISKLDNINDELERNSESNSKEHFSMDENEQAPVNEQRQSESNIQDLDKMELTQNDHAKEVEQDNQHIGEQLEQTLGKSYIQVETQDSQEMELTQNNHPTLIENIESQEMEVSQPNQLPVIENIQSQEMELSQSSQHLEIETDQSQDMVLTQNGNENVALDIDNTSSDSLVIDKETVTTTVIPLADVTGNSFRNSYAIDEEDDDDYISVSLNDFLSDIGIKFYDDLDIDIDSINRLSMSLTKESYEYTLVDYIRSLSKLQLLALYEFSCEELKKNIQDGKNVFSEFNKTIENNNPQLFKDYYLSDESERFNMNMKLQLVKDYTRHQSKKTWYDWRTQLTKNLILELEDKYVELTHDKEILISNIHILDDHILALKEIHENLAFKIKNLLKINKYIKSISSDDLQVLKRDLVRLKTEIKAAKYEIDIKQEGLDQINTEIVKMNQTKAQLIETLVVKEQKLNSTKKYDANDIKILNFKFNLLQDILQFKYINLEDKVFNFRFDNLVDIRMNFFDINDLNNIHYSISEDSLRSSSFFNKQLVPGFLESQIFYLKSENIIENFRNFKYYWDILKRFDIDLFRISLKFPIIRFELNTEGDVNFDIKYFNSETNLKLVMSCAFNFKLFSKYPDGIKITAKTKSTKVESTTIKQSLLSDIVPNGLLTTGTINKLTIVEL